MVRKKKIVRLTLKPSKMKNKKIKKVILEFRSRSKPKQKLFPIVETHIFSFQFTVQHRGRKECWNTFETQIFMRFF